MSVTQARKRHLPNPRWPCSVEGAFRSVIASYLAPPSWRGQVPNRTWQLLHRTRPRTRCSQDSWGYRLTRDRHTATGGVSIDQPTRDRRDRLGVLRFVLIWGTVVGLVAFVASSVLVGYLQFHQVEHPSV